jgi:ribosome assembly protein 1
MKEGCHRAILASSPRLTEPIYTCVVQVPQEFLGAAHGVISKRRGKIIDEDVSEATYVYSITAALPVVESFGLADELRKRTSGAAGFQLMFSHWAMLEQDPFYKPETEEELEEWGEQGNTSHNLARRYMDMTRRRKGLRVEEQVVQHAEKQRTISRKK